ncbi:MAG TPA: OsmC family peroxiredoxin [Bacteroidetes bacterium]|nr:OsmC family peroxiredoxin [Bacteroidota bacterium]
MEETVNLQHEEGLSFNVDLDGHNFKIDSIEKFGGRNSGPRPKNLMLVALGGCTGMDVASIMKKMKIPYEDFKVDVRGVLTETHPRHFERMHITYTVKGKNIDRGKVEKAVELSQEKYCGVTYNYRKSMDITHEIIIEE